MGLHLGDRLGPGRENEPAFLKALVRASPNLAWVKDPAGVFLACNPAAATFHGKTESEVAGKTDSDLFPAEEAEHQRALDLEAVASAGPVTHREWVGLRGNGRRVLLETVRTAVLDSAGGLLGVMGVACEITAADAEERALRGRPAAHEQIERIAATLPGVIFLYRVKPDGTACAPYSSDGLEELWGLRPEDLTEDAEGIWARVHPSDAEVVRRQLRECNASLSPWRGEFRVQHPRKGEVWLEGRAVPLREADGSILYHGFLTDISDRKRMEETLRASAARLEEAQCVSNTGSWIWDVERDSVEWSEALYRLSGREPEVSPPRYQEMSGMYDPESWQRLQAAVAQTLENGTPYELDLQVILPDSRRVWWAVRGEAERDGGGRIVRLKGTSQDITERKRAEEEVRAANAELAVIHSLAPVVFLVVDEDLRVEKVNETATRLAGLPEAEMIGVRPGNSLRCLNSLADPRGCGYGPACGACQVRGAVLDTVRNRSRHDNVEAWLPLPGPGGGEAEQRCLLVFTAPLEIHGRPKALVSILDITDRKRMEQELRVSEARFRTLAEDAPIAISASRAGRIVYANPTYLQMFGFEKQEELNDRPAIERYAPQCRGEVEERSGRRAQGLPVAKEYEAIGLRADGSEFPMLVVGITMQFGEGAALVAFITDLTAMKQAEEERSRLELQFRQAQKLESIGRLAGGVAHDFNNLLTIINGYSRMLLDRLQAGDPMRAEISEIHNAGERAAALTQQLLAFSRKQVLQRRDFDVNRLVRNIQPLLARMVGEDVELRLELHPEPASVCADPHQLEQVVMNLVVNSRDAMPRGGRISIETGAGDWDENQARTHSGMRAGGYVVLAVTDTGEGMDEETCQRVFEPFFTTKEVGKGTGLGLAMVQGMVAQSGGHIEVHSQAGRGTAFRIYLPKAESKAAEADQPEAAREPAGKGTVLVVEDQPEVRRFAAAALRARGYRVIPAESAAEALRICKEASERIDLVLTDVVMPHTSGRELADRLRERWPETPVLFMSGYMDDAMVRNGIPEEGVPLIQKPFTADQLAGRVREVLRSTTRRARILAADDEAGVRAVLRAILEGGGYEVIEAADGNQVLEEVGRGRVDLVITDLVMPRKEGIETIQELRRVAPEVGIIATSGAFEGEYLGAARMLGADATLAKPVDGKLLLATVAEILARQR